MGCTIEALFVAHVIKDAVGRSWRWAVGWLLKDPSSARSPGGWGWGLGLGLGLGLGTELIWLLVTQTSWGKKKNPVFNSITVPFGLALFSQQSFSSHSTPPSHSSAAHCSSSSHCGSSFTRQTFISALAWRLPLTPSLWSFPLYLHRAWRCYLRVDSLFYFIFIAAFRWCSVCGPLRRARSMRR